MTTTPTAETLRVLEEARALIADPSHWTKGPLAREADGSPTMPEQPEAACFCSLGALRLAVGRGTFDCDEFETVEAVLMSVLPETAPGVGSFNDDASTTHGEVLRAFDRALAATRARLAPTADGGAQG